MPRFWVFAIVLLIVVFAVYVPAWNGGFVWDDDHHVTRADLRSWEGLGRIWCDFRAAPQYYPLLHTAFWVEHGLWGDDPLGYHLVNIFLHVLAALLAARVLLRLQIPGAYFAAAIFALHPVQVESVAWITEQKNTLSAVFYFSSALAYLHFDQSRKATCYLAALAFFLLALLSKTVTATLPGALLVVFWWQRGRLSWRKDVLPLAPFFLLGAGLGAFSAWWELKVNNCVGPDFEFTWLQRVLIAGRVAWFHLAALFWPDDLTFIYPRWQVDPHAAWQYLFPIAAVVLLILAWSIRRWTRAPLAALLFFGGSLFPTLGFFNLYTFQYSLIANHYQYLACLGIFTLVSAGVALLLRRAEGAARMAGQIACAALLVVLAASSCQQSALFADFPTLFRATARQNPDSWMVHLNLGRALARSQQYEEAIVHLRKTVELKPDADSHYNLAIALAGGKKTEEAIEHFRRALDLKPDYADAHANLGCVLAECGRSDDAIVEFRKSLDLRQDNAIAHANLGKALVDRGKIDEAREHFQKALDLAVTQSNEDLADDVRVWIAQLRGPSGVGHAP